jgi:hypothetical protein
MYHFVTIVCSLISPYLLGKSPSSHPDFAVAKTKKPGAPRGSSDAVEQRLWGWSICFVLASHDGMFV